MHDVKWICENAGAFDRGLARRGLPALSVEVNRMDGHSRQLTTELQALQTRRNQVSREIGVRKSRGENADEIIREVARFKDQIAALEERRKAADAAVRSLLETVPNIPDEDVPDGEDEADNEVIRVVGTAPGFTFDVRDHVELGARLGLMDFPVAARLAGARFVITRGWLARLERALAAFMLDTHVSEFGYTEVNPPLLVRDQTVYGTGQLPKFGEDLFRTTTGHWLIPTAEVPLTNLVADTIVSGEDLPLRLTAHTPCFRSEAGAAGKDTRGMMRQHQFNKVELVSICRPEDSAAEHERMTACAEEILKRLGLHYRVVVLSTGDLGFSARKTYDLEVWLPGQGRFREISSCSNCGDFQARRMGARYRSLGRKGTSFVHSLNGSGLAVGRTLIAIMENCQEEDGSIAVPEVLRPYLDGVDRISSRETAGDSAAGPSAGSVGG